jgi:hypothetical protein
VVLRVGRDDMSRSSAAPQISACSGKSSTSSMDAAPGGLELMGVLRQVVDAVAPDDNAAKATLSRIIQHAAMTPTVYLPSHDPDTAKRLASRVVVPMVISWPRRRTRATRSGARMRPTHEATT